MGSFLSHLAAMLAVGVLTYLWKYAQTLLRKRKLGAILGFAKQELTFIYPPRADKYSDPSRVILPRTSTEDFLAINNILSALLQIRWMGEAHLKVSTEFHEQDRAKDLMIICSPVSNVATQQVLKELYSKHPGLPAFERVESSNRYYIRAGHQLFYSSTYDVVDKCIANEEAPEEAEMVDHAVIIKAVNPWDANNTILILAGIRGIGTWGAGEFLKKHWAQLVNAKRHDGQHRRSGPFAAVIEVQYGRGDLTGFRLAYFADLD